MLLRFEPSLAHAVNSGKNTALHLAASTGWVDVVRILLDAGANVNARGVEQFTPLHYACRDASAQRRHAEVVQLLRERGADPDARTASGALPRELAASDAVCGALLGPHAALRLKYEQRLRDRLSGGGADVDEATAALPGRLLCPIAHAPMLDPVDTVDGHTYERYAIEAWFEQHDTSPLTGLPLQSKQLSPNAEVREQVEQELRALAGSASPAGSPASECADEVVSAAMK